MHRSSVFCVQEFNATVIANTAKDRNIILGTAQEYRILHNNESRKDSVEERFVGLIVVPGQHLTKIELEEYDRTGIV